MAPSGGHYKELNLGSVTALLGEFILKSLNKEIPPNPVNLKCLRMSVLQKMAQLSREQQGPHQAIASVCEI